MKSGIVAAFMAVSAAALPVQASTGLPAMPEVADGNFWLQDMDKPVPRAEQDFLTQRYGSSGAPRIENFGSPGAGAARCETKGRGLLSYTFNDGRGVVSIKLRSLEKIELKITIETSPPRPGRCSGNGIGGGAVRALEFLRR